MRSWIRPRLCVVVLTVAAVVVCGVHLVKVARAPRIGPEETGAVQWLLEENRRSEDLDSRLAVAHRLRLAKRELAAEVMAGRLTLREAAGRCHSLDLQTPNFNWEAFLRNNPGQSEGECYCWQVIRYVEELLGDRPSEAAEVCARLEAELQGYREPDGTIRLPLPNKDRIKPVEEALRLPTADHAGAVRDDR